MDLISISTEAMNRDRLYQQKHGLLGGKEKTGTGRVGGRGEETENSCYLSSKRKQVPKGDSEIIRAFSPTGGPECTGGVRGVDLHLGFK